MTERPITEEDLHAYVDGALDASRRTEMETYLQRHHETAARVAAYGQQRAALRAALAPVADEPVPSRLSLARLEEARLRPHRFVWSAVAGAVLLLGCGGVGGWFLRGASEPVTSGVVALAQEAADTYAVYAPDQNRPVEIKAADRGELLNWIADRLHHPVMVPDLSASGFALIGGRVVSTAHGPAGMLMYGNDRGVRLAVLVRSIDIEHDTRMSQHDLGGVTGYAWTAAGIGYSVVAPEPPQRLHPLANDIRRQMNAARPS